MGYTHSDNELHELDGDMSAITPSEMARSLVEKESRGRGDLENAMARLERKYGIGRWQLAHLRGGRAKTCEVGLFQRLRFAYLDMCQRQITRLQHQITIEQARGGDDDLENMLAEAEALATRIKEKRQG